MKWKIQDFVVILVVSVALAGGFGYFFGRIHQEDLMQTGVQFIPDINHCFD